MFIKSISILFLVANLIGQECPGDTLEVNALQNSWPLPHVNNWDKIEVMTWNVKDFPLVSSTSTYLNYIITDMLPDIILFQEIDNVQVFDDFIDQIGGSYNIVHTNYGFLDFAIVTRSECVDVYDYGIMFTDFGYEFIYRYPLRVNLNWSCGLRAIDLEIINVHLKAFDEGFQQRYDASEIISDYVDQNISKNIIVAGDFNDEIDDMETQNSLWPLVSNSNVYFVTSAISADYESSTWIGDTPHSFLDHILISSELFDENNESNIETIRIDDYIGFSFYNDYVSDHRPVLWSFSIPEINIPNGIVINEIMKDPNSVQDSYGEWIEIFNIGDQSISLDGLVLRDNDEDRHIINNSDLIISPGNYLVIGSNSNIDTNGGVDIDYAWDDFNLSNYFDEIIIEHPAGIELDKVSYDYGQSFVSSTGYSMELINPTLDNNIGYNWILSEQAMSSGDYGSPGMQNNYGLLGDVNLDNALNVLDVVQIIGFIVGNITFTIDQEWRADYNLDSLVNVLDVVQIINIIIR